MTTTHTVRIGSSRLALPHGAHDIGRALDCLIGLNDESISRRHARIEVSENGDLTIEDLGSRNGTLVNGVGLSAGIKRPLGPGDSIKVGAHVLVIDSNNLLSDLPAGSHASSASGEVEPTSPNAVDPVLLSAKGLRSCPGCRRPGPQEASYCSRCGLDFQAVEVDDLDTFTANRPTLSFLDRPRPSGVVVVSGDPAFLRSLRPSFSVSEDLMLGAGATLDAALAALDAKPSLVLLEDTAVALDCGREAGVARARLGVPFALFGHFEDAEGADQARLLKLDAYVKRPVSPILFVARVRLCLARLKRSEKDASRNRPFSLRST